MLWPRACAVRSGCGDCRSAGLAYVILKGIEIKAELETSDVLHHLKSGSLDDLTAIRVAGRHSGFEGGCRRGSSWAVRFRLSSHRNAEPFGRRRKQSTIRVAGIFESGFYEFDDHWAFTSLATTQKLLSVGDVVNDIEIRADDPNLAPEVGKEAEAAAGAEFTTTNWEQQNKPAVRCS